MKLSEIGEFGFIERFKPLFTSLVKCSQVGIGDDCAVISSNDAEDWLVTTDLLMEDIHFIRNAITPDQLGYKSLAVNLSDIAAMGGTPVGSFLSIAIPPAVDVEYLDSFMKGYHELSAKYNTPLLGGDTTRSIKHIAINVCVLGKSLKGMARRRNMAKPGDAVCVTGNLGDSAGGLHILLNNIPDSDSGRFLLQRHLKPEPKLNEGSFLSGNPDVHAMIDISDGIASDLKHILTSSGVAAQINIDWLPLSEQLKNIGGQQGWNTIEMALGGGEDYELLFTVSQGILADIQKEFLVKFNTPVIHIGNIIEGTPKIHWLKDAIEVEMPIEGFNHFRI
jgi:thiamine-monophosphate kinase